MRETIRNTVYDERTKHNATQEDLAAALGVSRQTIIAIEKGNYAPSVLLALKIATYFKKPVESLFSITHAK
jgi:putative transcriptional regulator